MEEVVEDTEEEGEVGVTSVGRMATSHMNVLREEEGEEEEVAMEVVVAEVVDVSNAVKMDTSHTNVLEEEVADLEDLEVVAIEDGTLKCDKWF